MNGWGCTILAGLVVTVTVGAVLVLCTALAVGLL